MSSGFSPFLFTSQAAFPGMGSFSRSVRIVTTRSLQATPAERVAVLNHSNKSPGIEPFLGLCLVRACVPLASVCSYWPGQGHTLSLAADRGWGQLCLLLLRVG